MQVDLLYLQDIIESANAIYSFLEGVSKEQFSGSDLLQSAVLQKLMIVGESSVRISADLKAKYTEIPWKQIIGFRNIAVHAYFTLDLETVWTTATINIPTLKQQINHILQTDFPDFELRNKK